MGARIWRLRQRRAELILLLPALVLLLGLAIYPVLFNFWLSLHEKHSYLPLSRFVGFHNFVALAADAEFLRAAWNGFIYATSTIVLQVLLGTSAAVLFSEHFPGRNFFRGALLFPYLVPTIVVVILWKWLLSSSYGLINYLLIAAGVIQSPIVFFSQSTMMTTLVFVSVWQFFPFVTVAIAARLETIPEQLYQAARIDGAPTVARFIHITLPELRGTLISVVLLRALWMFTKFDTVWLLAGREGAGKYIETLPVYSYRLTFEFLQAGMGAAVAVVLLVILLVSSLAYLSGTGRLLAKS